MRIGDLCSRDLVSVAADTPVMEIVTLMRDRGVRRAPVVTSHGQLIGLISTDDLIAHLAGELSNLARLLERQPQQERR